MQLVLGKIFESKWKPLTLKTTSKRTDIDFKRVSFFAHWRGSQKQKTFRFANLKMGLAMQFKKYSLPDEWIPHQISLEKKPISHLSIRDSYDFGFSREI